jgi:hypothetical protein
MLKDKKVSAEIKRLKGIYAKVEAKHKSIIEGIIQRAAYMRITLEDYETDLDDGGYVEMFSQSDKTDPYERERPVARLYNTMNKNYQSIMKQLSDMLPKEQPKTKDDGFNDFVNGRDDV